MPLLRVRHQQASEHQRQLRVFPHLLPVPSLGPCQFHVSWVCVGVWTGAKRGPGKWGGSCGFHEEVCAQGHFQDGRLGPVIRSSLPPKLAVELRVELEVAMNLCLLRLGFHLIVLLVSTRRSFV